MRVLRSASVSLLVVGVWVVGCGKKESSGGPPTPAQIDANCTFLCADLLEGCPQPARTTSQAGCVNACKADYAKVPDKMKACSTKLASVTGPKKCTGVNDCLKLMGGSAGTPSR